MTTFNRIAALYLFIMMATTLSAEPPNSRGSIAQTKTEIMRLDGMDQSLALIFHNASSLDPARLRVYFNTGTADSYESQSQASLMMEGMSLYEYPKGAEGWNWNRIDAPIVQRANETLILIVSHPRLKKDFSYFIELTGSDWSVADRWPNAGSQAIKVRNLPTYQLPTESAAVDMQALLDARPESLSIQLNEGPDLTNWKLARKPNFGIANELLKSVGIDDAQLLFTLHDAATGEDASAMPSEAWKNGNHYAWKGVTLGVEWYLLIDARTPSELQLTGWLNSENERFIRSEIGFERSLKDFIWADDVETSRELIDTTKRLGHYATSRYGSERKQSYYPFAVVENEATAFIIETDPTEPRVFYLEADSNTLTANYEMSLTPETSKFPGQATFRCSVYQLSKEGRPGFRAALSKFNERHPNFNKRRVPNSGLWMPFTDLSTLPNPEDFGFAFFEKGGPRGSDVDFAKENNVLTLMYTEPWLYWLPFNEGENRTPEKALEKMRQIATSGSGWSRDLAASGLAGATQNQDNSIAMKFMDLPWNRGARMEVNTDLDLESVAPFKMNRAEAEWKQIMEFLSDPRVDGIYLDSMDAAVLPDFSARALAATDYPATFAVDRLQPQIPPMLPQYEFTSALSNYLHSKGKFLMGNFSIVDAPFVNQWIDIPGQETDWFSGGRYHPPTRARLNYRRAMSGQKPFGFLQSTDFSEFKGKPLQRYFETCLLYGFQPSFFSHNAADDPYWLDHSLLERDRHLFKTFVPHIQRLSDSGWQSLHDFESTHSANVQIEQFGKSSNGIWHIVLQNLSENIETVELQLPQMNQETLMVQPFNGQIEWISKGAVTQLTLTGHQTILLDLVAHPSITEELEFLKNWQPGNGEEKLVIGPMKSAVRENALGVHLNTQPASSPIAGEPTKWNITLINKSSESLDWRIHNQMKTVTAGSKSIIQVTLPHSETAQLLSGNITTQNGEVFEFNRSLKTVGISPIKVIDFKPRFLTRDNTVKVPLTLQNITDTKRNYTISWQTKTTSKQKEIELSSGSRKELTLNFPALRSNTEAITVTISSGGKSIWESKCLIVYLGADVSLAMDSGVNIQTDSTFGGYSTTPLNDGIMSTDNVAWNQGSWASTETETEHWIKIQFPKPTDIEQVNIHWNREAGITYTGRSGRVVAINSEGEKQILGTWKTTAGQPTSTVKFSKRSVEKIQLIQDALQGSIERPGIMWVSEVSVY